MSAAAFSLDIVIPVYNEQDVLPVLFERMTAALARLPEANWRIILVNDGSADATWRLIEEQHRRDARFVAIDLARNFGHQSAILAGLRAASADAVIALDG